MVLRAAADGLCCRPRRAAAIAIGIDAGLQHWRALSLI